MLNLSHAESACGALSFFGNQPVSFSRAHRNAYLKILLTIVLLFTFFTAEAETIDGPANVRRKPHGELLLSLDNKMHVGVVKFKNGWYHIAIPFYIDDSRFAKDQRGGITLLKGARLQNEDGKTIGHTFTDFNLDSLDELGYCDKSDEKHQYCIIMAYTAKQNIRPESIVENDLLNKLKANDLDLQFWMDHIRRYGYQAWESSGHFRVFFLPEPNEVDPVRTVRRCILYFYNKRLIAIYHEKPVPYSHFTGEILFADGAVINYLGKVPKKVKKELEDDYVTPMNFSD